MSGVSNEFAFLIFSIFVFVLLFLFVNFLLGIKTRIIAANTQNIND
jgi:hypothetical protein